MFFGRIGQTRWPPWPLIGWDIFDFSSETAEWNSTKLDRKQDLNVLYQVCVFRADRKNKMATLASDWLRHFRLLLWNHWMEFNETWQEARFQRPLPSLCFSGWSEKQDGRPGLWLAGWDIFDFSSETAERNSTKLDRKQDLNVLYQVCVFWLAGWSEKQDGRPGLWLAETFSTSPLKPQNGIQRNGIQRSLTGSKISMSSTKFVFFGPIEKKRWSTWPIRQKGGTLYSGARYVALWASCWKCLCRNFIVNTDWKILKNVRFLTNNCWQTSSSVKQIVILPTSGAPGFIVLALLSNEFPRIYRDSLIHHAVYICTDNW